MQHIPCSKHDETTISKLLSIDNWQPWMFGEPGPEDSLCFKGLSTAHLDDHNFLHIMYIQT